MLPKPEKKSRRDRLSESSPEQLDLVNTLSDHKKIEKKRNYVIFFLIITVGLSLAFWTFRSLHKYFSSPPSLKINPPSLFLPSLNKSDSSPNLDLSRVISPLISSDDNRWNIYVQVIGKNPKYWSLDNKSTPGLLASEIEAIQKLNPQKSRYSSALPEGVLVKESEESTQTSYSLKTLVLLPDNSIYLSILVNGSNLETSKVLFSPVIESIYWQTVSAVN